MVPEADSRGRLRSAGAVVRYQERLGHGNLSVTVETGHPQSG